MPVLRRLAAFALALTACTSGPDDGVVVPSVDGGKADALDHVAMRGVLELGAPLTGSFVEDLEFHGYTFAVGAGATMRIELSHLGSSSKLDATLFVFGPRTDAGFGGDAIAFDDDSGWGRLPRLEDLELDEGGEYLVVLGTADGRGRGHYRLVASCEGACDATPELVAEDCSAELFAGLQACVDGQIADGELDPELPTPSETEALAICSDGELAGGLFDDVCAADAELVMCGLSMETFITEFLPFCGGLLPHE
jgi:hypothetical protein